MRKFFTLAGVVVLTLAGATGAQAHSSIVKTIPQYQSLLQELPSEVSIEFSEEPLSIKGKAINSIIVTNPKGSVISLAKTQIVERRLVVKISDVDPVVGTYSVKYRMASADGHVISGSYRFDLKEPSKVKVTKEKDQGQGWGSHFLHLHKEHILQASAVLLAGAAWFVVRRRRES